MTTLHSPISTFTTPVGETFNRISRALNQYCAARSEKVRVAKHVKLLSVLDSQMLNDIGMKGFNRLAPEQQENVLLDAIRHA